MLVDTARPLADEIDALGLAPPRLWRVRVPGAPAGKARPRLTSRGRVYTPEQTQQAEARVRAAILEQVGRPLLAGPLALELRFVLPVPPSWSRRRREAALAGAAHPTGRPDFDNLAKLVCDAANGLLWADDAQVVAATVTKAYGADPHTALLLSQIQETP